MEEIENSNHLEGNEIETEEQKSMRLSNIYFSHLLHITHNMMSFNVNKDETRNLIIALCQQNNLSEEQESIIVDHIDGKD